MRRRAPAAGRGRKQHIVLSDQHIPEQDPDAEALSLYFLKDQQPDEVHLLGDILDGYPLSRHLRRPERSVQLQDDLDRGREYLEQVRDLCPKARIRYSEGNHEAWLTRYLWRKAEELSGLRSLSLPELLNLDGLDIEWVPASTPYKVGKLLFTHGTLARKHSGSSARGHQEKYGCPVIHGHTHRLGAFYRRTYDSQHGAWENGCLRTYANEYDVVPDWQHGFSIVWSFDDLFAVEQVCIDDAKFVYHGTLYESR